VYDRFACICRGVAVAFAKILIMRGVALGQKYCQDFLNRAEPMMNCLVTYLEFP